MIRLLADRLSPLSPRRTGGGTWEYSARVAFADRRMRYSWGEAYATEDSLATADALQAMVGIPLVDARYHVPGQPLDIERDGTPTLGVTTHAEYDRDQRAQVVRFNITDAQLIRDLRSGKQLELSVAYVPTFGDPAPDGALPQLSREPNHIAVVDRGRMPGTAFITDQGRARMDPEQIQAIAKQAAEAALAAEKKQRMEVDAAEAAITKERERADKAEAALSSVLEQLGAKSVDDVERAARALLADAVDADVKLLEHARRLGVELPETSTPATRRADLLTALKLSATLADSAEHADALIAALPDKQQRDPLFSAPTPAPGSSGRLTF